MPLLAMESSPPRLFRNHLGVAEPSSRLCLFLALQSPRCKKDVRKTKTEGSLIEYIGSRLKLYTMGIEDVAEEIQLKTLFRGFTFLHVVS